MIKHIVMWKLKDFAEGADKATNAIKAKEMLEALKEDIKEIKAIEVGINIVNDPQAYDLVLYSEFENAEGLEIYQNHPRHKEVGKFIGAIREARTVVDYK